MGQKTHPIGFRLGIVKDWNSTWFTEKHYADWLNEDLLLRKYSMARVGNAGVESVKIKRFRDKVIIIVATSRPGVVIGKKGTKADQLRAELQKMIGKNVKLDVEEVKKPELSAPLVADHIAAQLEGRVAFRRAMKKAIAITPGPARKVFHKMFASAPVFSLALAVWRRVDPEEHGSTAEGAGGDGDDVLEGGAGADTIYGDDPNDATATGEDTIIASPANDTITPLRCSSTSAR